MTSTRWCWWADLFFDRAADKIGNDGVDGAAVAFDEHSGLAGGDELGVHARSAQTARQLNGHHHFAETAIVADGVDA